MKRKKGFPSFPRSRFVYVLLSIMMIAEAISLVAQAVYLARAITFIFQGAAMQSIIKDLSLFLLAFLMRHVFQQIQQFIAERFSTRIGKQLREQLVTAYFHLGQRFVHMNGTGQLVTLAIEGIEQFKTYVEIALPRMLRTVIVPVVLVVYVFTLDTASAIILIATVPVVIIFMILLGIAAQKMADKQYGTYRLLSNHFIDTLKGLETLAYLGQSRTHETKIARVSNRYRKATVRTLRIAFLSSFALDFFTSLSIAFVAVGLGFRLIDGAIMLLPALTILILAPEYFLPIRQVGTDYHATLDGQIALEQVETILQKKTETERPSPNRALTWDRSSTLSLHNATVVHEQSDRAVLTDLSFSLEGNGAIGIVGESGAGKSTLIDVLAGFLPLERGHIQMNGVPAQLFGQADWLENIAYIPQQPYLFPASIADNLRFYEPSASDDDVKKVIQEIGLSTFVEQLPNGIDERIGEGGRTLSGGQEQRIAMGRALMSEKPILLLDELTAHLDIETEYEIKQAMLRLFENKLVILATHRLHWMKQMDHIIVLSKGRLSESGTHDDLLRKQGIYYELVDSYTEGGRHK